MPTLRDKFFDLIQRHVSMLQIKGDRGKGLCPLHEENTPSFTVDFSRCLWKCFGCSEGGKAKDLALAVGEVWDLENIPEHKRSDAFLEVEYHKFDRQRKDLQESIFFLTKDLALSQQHPEYYTGKNVHNQLLTAQDELVRNRRLSKILANNRNLVNQMERDLMRSFKELGAELNKPIHGRFNQAIQCYEKYTEISQSIQKFAKMLDFYYHDKNGMTCTEDFPKHIEFIEKEYALFHQRRDVLEYKINKEITYDSQGNSRWKQKTERDLR